MSIFLHFDGALAFQRFLRDRASHWPDWRRLRAWKHSDGVGFVLECPQVIQDRVPEGIRRLAAVTAQHPDDPFLLGEVWRRGRPVQRSQRTQSLPSCHLLIVEANVEDVARLVIEQAPAGLELLTLELEPGPGNRRVSGFLLHGDSGRMVAHAPPFGCRAYECDFLPRGGIAACPMGWSPPNLSEELWPPSSEAAVLYSFAAEGHSVTLATIAARQPVADLVTCQSERELALKGVDERMAKTPWRVVRRHTPVLATGEDDVESLGVSVVFRLRTFERDSAHAGDLTTGRGHRLGQSFLQILDECEAGLLPKVLYAGFDPKPYERWHFLYLDEAKARLLESWNMVERFDHLKELEPFGIRAFLSRRSMMLPPVKAMLRGGSDDLAIGERIRGLLGNPKKNAIVLIEDLESEVSETASFDDTPSNPRIVHIDLDNAPPLHKILPALVRDWHNVEPIEALGASMEPPSICALRERLGAQLEAIGIDEDDELRESAAKARNALARWADETATSLEKASKPVGQAQQLCTALNATLQSGEASIGAATRALAQYSHQLTNPRRDWVSEQTMQSEGELRNSAPSLQDAASVNALTGQVVGLLSERTAQLRNASTALAAFHPQLEPLEQDSAAALTRVNGIREEIERRAAATHARIADRRRAAQERLAEAQAVQERIQLARTQLNQQQEALRQLERKNEQDRASNERTRNEIAQQMQHANEERVRIERIRDQEIPRLRQQATEAERQLASLDPAGVQSRLLESQQRLERLNAAIKNAEAEADRLAEQLTRAESNASLLQSKQSAMAESHAKLLAMQIDAKRAEVDLVAKRDALIRADAEGGNIEDCRRRLQIANKALKELEQWSPGRKSFLERIFRRRS
jgi:hypothetical protein